MIRTVLILSILMTQMQAYAQPVLSLETYATGFDRPVDIAHAHDDRLFVVEQSGIIRVINSAGMVLTEPFLNIQDRVLDVGNSQGLLGLVFPEDHSSTGVFYVNYTTGEGSGSTRISRFMVDPVNPNSALVESEEIILTYDQPRITHNGGDLNFGPDGYLYIASGDGGGTNDPDNNGQDLNTFLGKILRLDVDTSASYRVPLDNPFVGIPDHIEEIWSYGWRHPWRFSFDRLSGNMWISDVGQSAIEEINFEPANDPGGSSYGWDCFEGSIPGSSPVCSDTNVFPVFEYPHNGQTGGYSVTGGYVYRGMDYPVIYGDYIFCDYVSNHFWTTSVNDTSGGFETYRQNSLGSAISTFGEDVNGELYVAFLNTGAIHHVEATCPEENPIVSIQEVGDSLVSDRIYGQFQWFLNGNPIDGANQNYYIPEEAGDFTLKVIINVKGCHYTAASNEIAYVVNSVEPQEVEIIHLFPNPATDEVQLYIQGSVSELELFDVEGKVHTANWKILSGNITIPVDQLPTGYYFVRMVSDDKVYVGSFMKE